MRTGLLLLAALAVPGCPKKPAASDASGVPSAIPAASASVAPSASASAAASSDVPVPLPSTSAVPSAAPSSAPAADVPLPKVKVENIGMHVGGGPFDEPTKEPIKKSVAPHFDELKKCYALVDPKIAGDFGVDLLLQGSGGKPTKVTHPRSRLKGEGFVACMTAAFEAIEFLPLKTGTTTVSYSLRFTPLK